MSISLGQPAIEVVVAKIKEGLAGVEKQKDTQEKYGGLDKGGATFGVVKRARDNDPDIHSNQTVSAINISTNCLEVNSNNDGGNNH